MQTPFKCPSTRLRASRVNEHNAAAQCPAALHSRSPHDPADETRACARLASASIPELERSILARTRLVACIRKQLSSVLRLPGCTPRIRRKSWCEGECTGTHGLHSGVRSFTSERLVHSCSHQAALNKAFILERVNAPVPAVTGAGFKVEQRGAAAGELEGCSNVLKHLVVVAVSRLEHGRAPHGAGVGQIERAVHREIAREDARARQGSGVQRVGEADIG